MNDTQEVEVPLGLLSGHLEGLSLPDLLWGLSRHRRTGQLHLRRGDTRKTLYLDRGRVVFAASNSRDDRLGELLLRREVIGLEQLERAVARLGSGKRIGTLLVEDGSLDADELVQGVLGQVESIVLGLFDWDEGEYRFLEGPLPTDELVTLGTGAGELLLQGIRSIRSFARIRSSVGSPRAVYGLTEEWKDALEGLKLAEGDELLVARLEQGEESVEGLCREVFLSNFEIYQTLWGLRVLGVVEPKAGQRSGDATLQGSLARRGFGELLVELGQLGHTGVLHVHRGSKERTFHIRDGRCVFATSNDNDDGLVAYLLRRGIISLRDREETSRRLLSNKRVGTILRELGVIDERDLREMVRQQLSEIVFDTFRWPDGDYAFVVGELPSIEQITLEATVQSLVAEGLRRVASWGRIEEGCGGVDRPLRLTPSYLDVLDRWDAGPDEWEVINALKEPATPREICSALSLSDYRVCQILWALRILGAVEPAPVEQVEVDVQPAVPVRVEVVDLDVEPADAPAGQVAEPSSFEPLAVEQERPPAEAGPPEQAHPAPRAERAVEEEWPTAVDESRAPAAEELGPELATDAGGEAETGDAAAARAAEAPEGESSPETTPLISGDDVKADLRGEPGEQEQEEAAAEPEEAARTVKLPREEVEAMIQGEEPAGPEEAPPWDPPEDLDEIIARFNAVQRVVYRTVRAEVGAGAANFIRSCCAPEPGAAAGPVAGCELLADGTWDPRELRRVVMENRIEDPWLECQRLIERELEHLRSHIGEAKVLELQRQIEKVERV